MEKYFVVWFTVSTNNPYHPEEHETIYNEDHFKTRNQAHKFIEKTNTNYIDAIVYLVKENDKKKEYRQIDIFCKV